MNMAEERSLLSHGEVQLKDIGDTDNDKKEFDIDSPVSSIRRRKWYQILWERDRLMIFIVIAVILGFAVGIGINKQIQKTEEPQKSTILIIIGFPGELLMRMLKMLILPLIVSSLIVGLAALDQKASGRLGRRAFVYYMGTTFIAVILGVVLVLSLSPGSSGSTSDNTQENKKEVRPLDSFLDLARLMFPENLIRACFEQDYTPVAKLSVPLRNVTVNLSRLDANETAKLKADHELKTILVNATTNETRTYYTIYKVVRTAGKKTFQDGTNVLGLVVFSIAVGVTAGKMGTKAAVFVEWVSTLNEIVMSLVGVVMWYSPIGIWSLISAKFAEMGDIPTVFQSLALYMVTVILGLLIHSLVLLPLLYFIVVRKNPFRFLKGILQALLTAFGTSSSSATLPVTFRCLEVNNRIDKRVTRFVLPVGATINMDGTALYEAVAVIFIAQSLNYPLNFGQYIAISLTATLAAIGAAGIPQAGLVTMLIVLQTVGLPEKSASLIFAVDWFLDRIRTTVNVLGDSIGAGIVEHLSKSDLAKMDARDLILQEEMNMANAEATVRRLSRVNSITSPRYDEQDEAAIHLNSDI